MIQIDTKYKTYSSYFDTSQFRMRRRDKIQVCFKHSLRVSMADEEWTEHCRRFGDFTEGRIVVHALKVVLDDVNLFRNVFCNTN